MLPRLFFLVSLSALLAGCALPGVAAVPTPYPPEYLPTVIYLTAESINATRAAAITPTLTPTLVAPTPAPVNGTPGATPTFTPGPNIPTSAIQINAPGPMSRVASPLEIQAIVVAGASHRDEVDLFGEDGTLLSRSVLVVHGYPGGDLLNIKMPFEIRAAGETATVQISTKDAHGRVQSLNFVQVLLISTGSSQINPPGNNIYERVAFYDLPIDAHISGGSLAVKGRYAPVNNKPTILELVADDGTSLGLRVLNLTGGDGQYFETTIPYKVTQLTAARLYLYQDDEVIQGRAYVYSQPLALNP